MKNTHIVINRADADAYLTTEQTVHLRDILKEIEACRGWDRKPTDNRYLVINLDEPYAEEVIEIMRRNGHWEDEA